VFSSFKGEVSATLIHFPKVLKGCKSTFSNRVFLRSKMALFVFLGFGGSRSLRLFFRGIMKVMNFKPPTFSLK